MTERNDRADRYRPRRSGRNWILALLVVAAALFGWRWWSQRQAETEEDLASAVPSGQTQPDYGAMPPATQPAPPSAETATPAYPLDTDPSARLPTLAQSDSRVAVELNRLLGRPAVQSFLRLDGFVRRAVATVDNLDRPLAPASLWPVQPTTQRFTVDRLGATPVLGADNARRYAGFVALAESIDTARAVALYRQLYPLFQQAYEELGYPRRYFNDRLVAAIDHLLQAPEPAGPVSLKLVEVKGQVPSTRPWTRYEFADPQLEALSAGQKVMVRMGVENERRLKAKLREVRAQVGNEGVGAKR
ncbi:MAG: hypothetical protein JWQ03_44 [Variovorax sp.]|nr:hypothetical protein [Variovorax sp.]